MVSIDEIKQKYSFKRDVISSINSKLSVNSDILKQLNASLGKTVKYTSLKERLISKYQNVIIELPVPDTSFQVLCFDSNFENNKQKLNYIINNLEKLKKRYADVLENVTENDVYFKTIDNLKVKLDRILNGNKFMPEKISGGLVKVLNQTIIKNYANNLLQEYINEFFENCSFKKVVLMIGKKIDDEDYEYIREDAMKIEVSEPEKHNTIIEKRHDAFEFLCYDEDEKEFFKKIIPGEYAIGYYS